MSNYMDIHIYILIIKIDKKKLRLLMCQQAPPLHVFITYIFFLKL